MMNNQNQLQEKNMSPKDVFMHLLLIITLYMSVVGVITLLFQYVDLLLPDPLDSINSTRLRAFDSLRWWSAVLIVAFPVFMGLSWFLEKEFKKNPIKRELKIRKWLVYLTLFIAAIVIIIDLIVLLSGFYGGELTSRSLLKIGVVLVVAATVFGYYLWELQRERTVSSVPRWAGWASSIVVLIVLVSGFFIAGSPAYQRKVRFDEQRIQHLQSIQNQIVSYWSQKEELPEDLSELEDGITGFSVPRDPETGNMYEYNTIEDLSFELCAVFETEAEHDTVGRIQQPVPVSIEGMPVVQEKGQSNWRHDVGKNCFERTIDPELHQQR